MTRAELKNAAKEQIKGKIGILFVMLLIIGATKCSMWIYSSNRTNWSFNYSASI